MKFNNMFHKVKRSSLLPAAIAGALGVSVLFATGAAAQPSGSHEKPDGPKPTVNAFGWSVHLETSCTLTGVPVTCSIRSIRCAAAASSWFRNGCAGAASSQPETNAKNAAITTTTGVATSHQRRKRPASPTRSTIVARNMSI